MFWSVVLVLIAGATGWAQVSMSTGMNYEKVALKKWYVANQVTTFLTGPFSLPLGIQFDGANIWVTNSHDNTNWLFVVKKRRPPKRRPIIVDLWSANMKLARKRGFRRG
jgi:hypothetical protein